MRKAGHFEQHFERFNEGARETLRLAQEEAQRFNHNYIGTEHLLLGLARQENTVAAQVLTNLDVELQRVRNAVEFIIGRGDRTVLGEIGMTPRGKKVIELAIDEAGQLNHDYIGPEHLLLGLVREGEGIAAGVLESLGVNMRRVRKATLQALGQPVPEAPPEPAQYGFAPGTPPPPIPGAFPLAAVGSLAPMIWAFRRYRPLHIDSEQRERRPVGSGANPRPMAAAPYSAVWGTLLGWVVVNTGGAFTLRLYNGFAPAEEPFAVISDPPTGACFPYHYVLKQGLTYRLEGTPGSVTIVYDEMQE